MKLPSWRPTIYEISTVTGLILLLLCVIYWLPGSLFIRVLLPAVIAEYILWSYRLLLIATLVSSGFMFWKATNSRSRRIAVICIVAVVLLALGPFVYNSLFPRVD